MNWTEISIKTSAADLQTASDIATAVSSGGLYIEDYSDILGTLKDAGYYDYIADGLIDRKSDLSVIHIYFSSRADAEEAGIFLTERLGSENIGFELALGAVSETDWADGWKKYYKPLHIGKRIVICPSWEDYSPADGEIVVILDPGMSFGTGDHESTKLCLTALEETVRGGERVLDAGAGSGILGIAALKLGAESVTAVDFDENSVRIASENAAKNGVRKDFTALRGDVGSERDLRGIGNNYDICAANIVADVHIACAAAYRAKLKPEGILVAGGIISERTGEVQAALRAAGFEVLKVRSRGGWEAITARRAK